jgi:hypothetical protein
LCLLVRLSHGFEARRQDAGSLQVNGAILTDMLDAPYLIASGLILGRTEHHVLFN